MVHCDYLKRKERSVNRRRIDPVITLSTIFEEMLNEMREMSDAQPFLFPVNVKVNLESYAFLILHTSSSGIGIFSKRVKPHINMNKNTVMCYND